MGTKRLIAGFIKLLIQSGIALLLAGCTTNTPSGIPNGISLPPTWTVAVIPYDTPWPSNTPTPLPTLVVEEKLAVSKELLTINAGCRLPCWWGFTPGETKWEDAKSFLETLAWTDIFYLETNDFLMASISIIVLEDFNLNAGEFPDTDYINTDYFIKDGIINPIDVHLGPSHIYDLPKLLYEYSQPDEVYVDTEPERFQGSLQTSLFVFYKSQGIFVYFEVPGTEISVEIQGCFQNDIPSMMLWSPGNEWSYLKVIKEWRNLSGIDISFLIEEVTDMDEEIFYQTYQGTTLPICITVPREPFYRKNSGND